MRKSTAVSILALFVLHAFGPSPKLFAQESFYKGKTIRLIVGSTPGGFYDRWARIFAKHMPKHIAGNPEIVVQNMPGAG